MCHTSHLDIYTVSDRLLRYLLGPKGHSYNVCETSFQEALGTVKPRWDWLAERVSPKEITNDGIGYPGVPDPNNWLYLSPDADGKIPRPELDTFSLAMVGGGKVSAASHPFGMVPNNFAMYNQPVTSSNIIGQTTRGETYLRVQLLLT